MSDTPSENAGQLSAAESPAVAAAKPPLEAKAVSDSRTHMTELVLAPHINALSTVFGGVIMSWMDICAGIAGGRHAGRTVVTVSVDDLHFLRPIFLGDRVLLEGVVTSVGRSSVEVYVTVAREPVEDPSARELTTDAYFTMVALDADRRPTAVPPLLATTPEEREQQAEAAARREARLELKKAHANAAKRYSGG